MIRNWSKIVLVSMLVTVLGVSLAFATTSRVRSLANTGDYYSDDSNVNRWYGTLTSYANQVTAEVGQFSGLGSLSDTRGLSWTFKGGEYGTYRISLNENQLDHPGLWSANPFFTMFTPGMISMNVTGPGTPAVTPINTWDIAGGWDVGENMSVGVSITRSRFSWEMTQPDTSVSNSWTTFGAGLSWSNNEDMAFDALVNVAVAGGTMEGPAGTKAEWDSKNALNVAGRLFYDWLDNVTVPVTVEFINAEYSSKTSAGALPLPNGDKVTAFKAGAGVTIDVNQNSMFVLAAEVGQHKWEYSNPDTNGATITEIKTTYLPMLRMGLETHVKSWLTARVGAERSMGKTQYTRNNGQEIKTYDGTPAALAGIYPFDDSEFNWYLGLGFDVSEWTIDVELNENAPFSVGYWLTGYTAYPTAGTGPVARISAVYNY